LQETPVADEHHSWAIGGQLPVIRPHSVANHRIIAKYLSRYINTLTCNQRMDVFKVTLVDGFAGGGLYCNEDTSQEHFGSPLLMLKTMQEAEALLQKNRKKEFKLDVEYHFVESSQSHLEFLKQTLEGSEFKPLLDNRKINLFNDEFVNQAEPIIKHVQKRHKKSNRAIFVLDQFGYTAVPFPIIRKIMASLNQAEVILTFATDSLIAYINDSQEMQRTLAKTGLCLSKKEIQSAKMSSNWRLAIQLLLHREIFQNSGANHYTPFFIRSKEANRDYWLIHLSNHCRARDVMVGLHWEENTSFAHYGGCGLDMFGYDPDDDIEITCQPFLFDHEAEKLTIGALYEDVPKQIHAFGSNGVSFDQFFRNVTNRTPATSFLLKKAIKELQKDGRIDIRDQTGLGKRSSIREGSDILRKPAQGFFFT